ncbi:MAG: transporter permease [Paenibacillaceae bacterium]|jgi:ABC-type multidrug transport system fused ATPase/permease subunit|nr:transporter permease [Paenibacillaceae bacterium]
MRNDLKDNKLLVAATVLFSILTSAAGALIAVILQKVIDAAADGDMGLFQRTLLLSVLYLLGLGVLSYIYSLCSKILIRNLTKSLRRRVFHGIFRRNHQDFTSANTADYLSSLTNDTKLIEENYILPLLAIVQSIAVFFVSLVTMLFYSPLVTACLAGSIIVMLVAPSLFGKALQNRQDAFSGQMAVFTSKLKDLLAGYEVIKSYRMGRHTAGKFERENNAAANAKFAADKLFAANESVSEMLAGLSQFSVIFISAYLIITGHITMGTLIALVQLSNGFVGPVMMMMQNLPKVQGIKPVISRLNALADYEDTAFTGKTAPVFQSSVEANNLNFTYLPGQPVLADINLVLQKGRKYAVAGRSGCGKSTLVKLLTGYYAGFEGRIAFDGTDIKHLDVEQLGRMVSTIHQNVYMFDTDIRNNICLYRDFPEQELTAALEGAGVSLFLEQMPDGLLSPVGENGSSLSGGQRQRIAVARALIQGTPFLILDEGTSGIDRQTAYDIESRLLAQADLTLITITHDMNEELLGRYDEIFYMDQGRIAERGSLQQLLEGGNGFADFFTLQKRTTGNAL